MKEILFTEENSQTFLLVEQSAFEGVKKIASVVAEDFFTVTGKSIILIDSLEKIKDYDFKKCNLIIAGTIGKSSILDSLATKNKIDFKNINGKNEVYSFSILDSSDNILGNPALVISGSDKRGTIYGLLHISELLGVSPWTWWSEVKPVHKNNFSITENDCFSSKEPSVELRGIFINDEWPAFGSWCFEKFGGFNSKMYEQVFILLLRLKANYLWPAMWTSSFPLDGPGLANEELADTYGIVIGFSHHEPCLRASEEWDKVKGANTPYGTAWDFTSNSKGLTNYWRDSLKRSGKFENTITVGMRGERDSILNETATLKDNIDNLKKIITEQNKLIAENVNSNLQKTKRVLAVYKEVETYFEGNDTTEGLKDWSGLEGITCMLCDDNFGNMRVLPDEAQKNRNGGWGMYYHFDYHGGPTSYEWMNSTSLTKTQQQMSRAYNSGIKNIWIVNVGDLVGQELPISYFIDLAFDFEKYSSEKAASNYTEKFVQQNFGNYLENEKLQICTELLNGLMKFTSQRKSEALNENIYSPCNFHEGERMFFEADTFCKKANLLLEKMPAECKDSFIDLIYYPVVATLNIVRLNITGGRNNLFASQMSAYANTLAQETEKYISYDNELRQMYYKAANGKWNHFADSAHTGFRSWNDEDYRFPVLQKVVPLPNSKMIVSFSDNSFCTNGGFWCGRNILINNELTNHNVKKIYIDISNGGSVPYNFKIECSSDWLSFSTVEDTVDVYKRVEVVCDRSKFSGEQKAEVKVIGSFGKEANVTAKLLIIADNSNFSSLEKGTFVESENFISMSSCHGKKVEPSDSTVVSSTKFKFFTKSEGTYTARLYLEAANPSTRNGTLLYRVDSNGKTGEVTNSIPSKYTSDCSCSEWEQTVLSNKRISECEIELEQGINEITFNALDKEVVLKSVVLFLKDKPPADSYLPPPESFVVQ
ncbi:MAG: glycosyl hydrolase 115 family protein [Treponema sp.]